MTIANNLQQIRNVLPPQVTLVAVSKTHPSDKIKEAYDSGQRIFGENKVQELVSKAEQLPKDISWHLIGHLQSNKVKYIAPFVSMIHAVDSLKLLLEINKQAEKNHRGIDCLIQIHIAKEETKFGMSYKEAEDLLYSGELQKLSWVRVVGLMGMATNTEDMNIVRQEFRELKKYFDQKRMEFPFLNQLSMGMSSDYGIAVEEGSTMIRVGSSIFGIRN
jgi:pyridoxal phosphate enzyme (YggS family)